MGKSSGGNTFGEDGAEELGDCWPPHFPHREIDALLARLDHVDALSVDEATELLGMVAREAQRLRATVVRLSATKLSEADQEARAIVADAQAQAKSMRSLGLSVLDDRLDEADHLLSSMRAAFRVELRAASQSPQPRGSERLFPNTPERGSTGQPAPGSTRPQRFPRLPEQPQGGSS